MKAIICGAGRVGSGIAQQLAMENNDVVIIDHDELLLRQISDTMEVRCVLGHGSDPAILAESGIHDADAIIAVTAVDEVNMIACQVAHSMFATPLKIARIRYQGYLHPAWRDLYRNDHLPVDQIISPEIEVAEGIISRLHVPGAIDTGSFGNGEIRMIEIRCLAGSAAEGLSPDEIQEEFCARKKVKILAVLRNEKLFIGDEITQIQADDEVYLLAAKSDMHMALELLGHQENEARRIVILGGGNIGLYLASALEEEGGSVRVKIIENHRNRAEYIAEQLSNTTVLCGSALESEILQEASISQAEAVIAVTNDDKVNILASMLAKKHGCKRVVSLVNNYSYSSLISNLGIDVVISPKETTISSILQYVRRGKIQELYAIAGGEAEIIEIEISDGSNLIGRRMGDISLSKGVYWGMILRGANYDNKDGVSDNKRYEQAEILLPDDELRIENGDRIIIITHASTVSAVEKLCSSGMDYLWG